MTNLEGMFDNARSFNQDIGSWDVSNVTNMSNMFYNAETFNQDIAKWNVSKVTTMWSMFEHAESFNQNIGNWDVSNVIDMGDMFNNARSFNQDISNWKWLNKSKIKDIGDVHEEDEKVWIAMEKSTFYFGDDEEFEATELKIEFSHDGDGEYAIIENIKKTLKCEHLIFSDDFRRIIDLPEIDDSDGYGDGGTHGPFSSEKELIDYVKQSGTISFKNLF